MHSHPEYGKSLRDRQPRCTPNEHTLGGRLQLVVVCSRRQIFRFRANEGNDRTTVCF